MPPLPPHAPERREQAYRLHAMIGLAASLLTVTATLWLWPAPAGPDAPAPRRERGEAPIVLVPDVVPTRQSNDAPAAPPPPPDVLLPPIEVPDDVFLREPPPVPPLPPLNARTELGPPAPLAVPGPPIPAPPGPPGPPGPPPAGAPNGEAEPRFVEAPDRSPVPVRFAEPAYPPEAQRNRVKARIRVEVFVDERGRVTDTRVVERVLIGRGDREEVVPSLPYGIEEAALAAAERCLFRPARHDGEAVQTRTTLTFSVGV